MAAAIAAVEAVRVVEAVEAAEAAAARAPAPYVTAYAAEIAVQLQALAELQVDLQRRVHQLNQELGSTLILVTHDMALASRCERQMVLNNGRVVVAA